MEFEIYFEYSVFKKGDIIKNHKNSELLITRDYRVWWKTILHYLTLGIYKPYKSPFIYTVKEINNTQTKELFCNNVKSKKDGNI